jgi:general secretion pathway protein G
MTAHAPQPGKARRYFERLRNEDGLTLIELLVVLAIIGLITAIATPQVIGYLDRAKISTTKAQIQHMSTALDLFKLDTGRYPTTEEGLAALMTAPKSAENWSGPYLKARAALNDPWGAPYQYRFPGQHSDYDLFSGGPKNAAGGSNDAIGNWQ